MPLRALRAVCLLALLLTAAARGDDVSPPAAAPSHLSKEELDMKLKLDEATLRLRQAERNYKRTEQDYREAQELLKKGIYTSQEVTANEQRFHAADKEVEEARINLERTALSFFTGATHITVLNATKYRTLEATLMVRLELKNTSDLSLIESANRILERSEQTLEQKRALLRVENMVVSLLTGGVVVGQPLEHKVAALEYNELSTLTFKLQRDLEALTIKLDYLGRSDQRTVYLDTEAQVDVVTLTSSQFSQVGELGAKVVFDLSLERLGGQERNFSLACVGLAEKYRRRFLLASGAALSQVKFVQGKTREDLKLEVSLPKELPAAELDRPLAFLAVVADPKALEAVWKQPPTLADLEREGPAALMRKHSAGFERLLLTPKGTGELTLTAQNFYHELKAGGDVSMTMELENSGTLPLTDIRIATRPAYGWRYEVQPERGIELAPTARAELALRFWPQGDLGVGDYEMKVEATCQVAGKEITAEEKVIRVHVEAESSLQGSLIIVGVLIGALLLVVFLVMRLARR